MWTHINTKLRHKSYILCPPSGEARLPLRSPGHGQRFGRILQLCAGHFQAGRIGHCVRGAGGHRTAGRLGRRMEGILI